MFSSARLKACTSLTAEMFSCNSALTLPMDLRDLRNILRAWAEKYSVAMSMTGATTTLRSAKGTFVMTML